jgi:hypothetical protein
LDDEYIPIVCSIRGENDAWLRLCWFAISEALGLAGTADQQGEYYKNSEVLENQDC